MYVACACDDIASCLRICTLTDVLNVIRRHLHACICVLFICTHLQDAYLHALFLYYLSKQLQNPLNYREEPICSHFNSTILLYV